MKKKEKSSVIVVEYFIFIGTEGVNSVEFGTWCLLRYKKQEKVRAAYIEVVDEYF